MPFLAPKLILPSKVHLMKVRRFFEQEVTEMLRFRVKEVMSWSVKNIV